MGGDPRDRECRDDEVPVLGMDPTEEPVGNGERTRFQGAAFAFAAGAEQRVGRI